VLCEQTIDNYLLCLDELIEALFLWDEFAQCPFDVQLSMFVLMDGYLWRVLLCFG